MTLAKFELFLKLNDLNDVPFPCLVCHYWDFSIVIDPKTKEETLGCHNTRTARCGFQDWKDDHEEKFIPIQDKVMEMMKVYFMSKFIPPKKS